VYLIPHIDFRVAPSVYGPAFARIGEADADLFVIIGTSHYWGDHRVILTRKHHDTPLGVVHVDRGLVDALEQRLLAIDDNDATILAPNDLAHRPEHSIELHTVLLKHVRGDRPFHILPILVTGVGGEHDPDGVDVLQKIASCVRDVVQESGRKTVWLISGDLSHVGVRFGDDEPARDMLENVRRTDGELLEHLVSADAMRYHEAIEREEQRYRVCGHAPTLVGLFAAKPSAGKVLAYEVWDDADTDSAVTFATMAFSS
jgi:AmmeMemoRadiSam system protein B